MVRSWDARVKGASQRVEPGSEEYEGEGQPPQPSASDAISAGGNWDGQPEESPFSDLVSLTGMSMALNAMEVPTVVVERSSGLIHWMSEPWAERFGEQSHVARYFASTTDLGEAPLPPPGEAWQRTRSITDNEGLEDLADLLLLGAHAPNGTEVVAVIAIERAGSGSIVTDRSEAIAFVDGALDESQLGSVAVLYVDLDRFKVVHDLVGNVEALRLLELVSRRISSTIRGSDLLFRLPSDEFVVVACEVDGMQEAEDLAERIRSSIATMNHGQNMAITASIGVAMADGEFTADELLSASETAVYMAKGRGRNRVAVHDEELRTRSQRLLTVERQLREAIDNRDVKFAYQPLVALENETVVGAEALLRLGGEIGLSAIEVVGAAEQSGLMGTLGTLVLEGVEEQLGDLLKADSKTEIIMVNLAATQLADEGLISTLKRLSADADIPNGRLAVEVPEVVVAEHREAFAELVALVRPKFKVGIDGFGTSFSSLETLESLEVDYVKLHRSLTMSVGVDASARDDVAALIAGADRLGTTVVALGVERQDQATVLQSLGCSFAQGFLYAGAVTAEDFRELMASGFIDAASSKI